MDNNTVLINLIVGTVVVPPVIEFLKVKTWSNNAKRLLGLIICFIVAGIEFWASGGSFESFAITGPVLFAMATGSYHLFFQGNLGVLDSISPLGAITAAISGNTNGNLTNTTVAVEPPVVATTIVSTPPVVPPTPVTIATPVITPSGTTMPVAPTPVVPITVPETAQSVAAPPVTLPVAPPVVKP